MHFTPAANLQYRRFNFVLRDLMIEADVTNRLGSPDWPAFADKLVGVSYETLRKALSRERTPSPKVLEAAAAAFGVSPEVFVEYRLVKTRLGLDPKEVGWQAAIAELRRIEELQHRAGRSDITRP